MHVPSFSFGVVASESDNLVVYTSNNLNIPPKLMFDVVTVVIWRQSLYAFMEGYLISSLRRLVLFL